MEQDAVVKCPRCLGDRVVKAPEAEHGVEPCADCNAEGVVPAPAFAVPLRLEDTYPPGRFHDEIYELGGRFYPYGEGPGFP